MGLGVELVVGVVMLFGGGAWLAGELDRPGVMTVLALATMAAGGYVVWNGLTGGPLLLDPARAAAWLPTRFN